MEVGWEGGGGLRREIIKFIIIIPLGGVCVREKIGLVEVAPSILILKADQ